MTAGKQTDGQHCDKAAGQGADQAFHIFHKFILVFVILGLAESGKNAAAPAHRQVKRDGQSWSVAVVPDAVRIFRRGRIPQSVWGARFTGVFFVERHWFRRILHTGQLS
jgi:hypothetical protein